jgi:hypothetical protein
MGHVFPIQPKIKRYETATTLIFFTVQVHRRISRNCPKSAGKSTPYRKVPNGLPPQRIPLLELEFPAIRTDWKDSKGDRCSETSPFERHNAPERLPSGCVRA